MRLISIVLSVLFAVYSIFTAVKWKKLRLWQRMFVILGAIGSISLGGYSYFDYRRESEEKDITATYGEIETKHFVNPDITLKVRGSKAKFGSHNGVIEFGLLDNLLRVSKVHNKLYAHVILRDIDGSTVAIVEGDYWKVYKEGYDYNNDKTGFEVVTADRRVLFQIDLKEDTAHFAGLLLDSKANGIYFYTDPTGTGGAIGQSIEKGQSYFGDFALSYQWIRPIFKYPRERYPHQRVAE